MAWFAVDDGFDNHPKIRKAGNAAAGLFCRLGAYSARHNTEGVVPGPVARDYGTAAQLRKLTDLSMLHPEGHACGDCVQPDKGDYVIHDYLEYNRSKSEVKAARDAGAERQRRRRARLAEEAAAVEAEAESKLNRGSNRGPNRGSTRGSGEPPTEPRISDGDAGQDDPSRRYTLKNARVTSPAQPIPTLLPSEEELASGSDLPRIGDRPRIPEASRPLVEALTQAGMVVGWELQSNEWFLIEAFIKKSGVSVLVDHAGGMWQNAKSRPRSGSYFIPGWRALPEISGEAPAAPRQQSKSHQPYTPPTDPSVYESGFHSHARPQASGE
ncbi:mucin-2 [Streptomyces sp. NBC_00006]|uniref:mucin-2 n=1 Tax=Streptomyces sp. NBC_00006 TaxID=2975619 RepID=UPI0022577368|nr:mucin-2 [Streptomyces sp. NBC_00006]MCX5528997.1 mucin-2 [Streptomyces sp. NBC_00006]MCX5537771.1 mucin-2 [Streptomyces sp. NBC_00006]